MLEEDMRTQAHSRNTMWKEEGHYGQSYKKQEDMVDSDVNGRCYRDVQRVQCGQRQRMKTWWTEIVKEDRVD